MGATNHAGWLTAGATPLAASRRRRRAEQVRRAGLAFTKCLRDWSTRRFRRAASWAFLVGRTAEKRQTHDVSVAITAQARTACRRRGSHPVGGCLSP